MRGIYWTIPDEKGKEVSRDVPIDEVKIYTQSFLNLKIHILMKFTKC